MCGGEELLLFFIFRIFKNIFDLKNIKLIFLNIFDSFNILILKFKKIILIYL